MIFGHKRVTIVASVLWTLCTIASGFSKNFIALCVMRALTGVGGGFMVPNTLALLTIAFPPGRMRNATGTDLRSLHPVFQL